MAKILVVEDNAFNLELVTDLLEAAGHTVLAAGDGTSGVQVARREQPGLILMDVSLPGINGYEATRLLQADQTTNSIPVVMVSAHALKEDEEKFREAGASGYLSKPIDTRKFVQVVEGYLAGA